MCIAGDQVDRRLWRLSVKGGWGRAREAPLSYGRLGQHLMSRGNTLVYSDFSWEEEIWESKDGRGNEYRLRVGSTGGNSAPNISPDQRQIAFVSARSGRLAVWVAERDGANAAELAPAAASFTPRWSPTGKEIAYTCRRRAVPNRSA